jgi:hypothetical protein
MALRYVLEVDDKGTPKIKQFGDESERSERKVKQLGTSTERAGRSLSGAGKDAQASSMQFATMAAKAFLVYQAATKVVGGLASLNAAAAKRAEGSLLLTRALGYESDALRRQAEERENNADFSVAETQAMQAQMAAVIRNEEMLLRLTPAIQDFAKATGKDLRSATEMVTKSISSNTNALKRSGIEITGAAGSVERYESALGALEKRYAGAAVEAAKADQGMTAMRNAVTSLAADFGDLLGPSVLATTNYVRSLVAEWRTFLAEIKDPNKEVREDLVRINDLLARQHKELESLQAVELNPKYPLAAKATQERIALLQKEIATNNKLRDSMDEQFNKNLAGKPAPPPVEGTGIITDKDGNADKAATSAAEAERRRVNDRAAKEAFDRMANREKALQAYQDAELTRFYEDEDKKAEKAKETAELMLEMRLEMMGEEERAREEAILRRDERIAVDVENEVLRHQANLAYAHEIEQMEAAFAEKRAQEHEKEMQRIAAERDARLSAATSMLGSLATLAGMSKKNHALQKALLIGQAWGNTYLAATRALATPPAPNFWASGAALLEGGTHIMGITSKMVVGGMPAGRNAVVQMNEAGQEFVGNAGMTRTLGRDFVERGNNGATREELAEMLGTRRGGVTLNIHGAVTARMIEDEVIPILNRYEMARR